LKVLIVGRKINLGQMLAPYGVESTTQIPVRRPHGDYDISIVYGAWSSKRVLGSLLLLPGVKIMLIRGTDAYRMSRKTKAALIIAQRLGLRILYAGDNLKKLVGLEGEVWATPVLPQFKNLNTERDVDVLFYCNKGWEDIYCLDKFKQYIAETGESYTIADGSTPADEMPALYNRHRKYIRFTTHDANPKMPLEAFLCGCESWDNGRQITEVPDFMLMENAVPRLVKIMEDML
jgi:hypothetical protein